MATKANYNMSKDVKRMLAITPKDMRSNVKSAMIDAQIASEKPAPGKRQKENDEG